MSAPANLSEDEELLRDFLTEADEKIAALDLAFVALEREPARKELVEEIFRHLHTLKGNSGFFGLSALGSLAHQGESVLAEVRSGALAVTPELITLLLECADGVRAIVEHINRSGSEGADVYGDLRERLASARAGGSASATGKSSSALPVSGAAPALEAPALEAELPAAPGEPPGPLAAAEPALAAAPDAGAPAGGDGTVRVPVRLIEDLMNQVGELVLCRNQLLQHLARADAAEVEQTAQTLDHLTTRLQENMMKTRLQPIGTVFNKFPRIVRDLARMTGKVIELRVEGQSTEIDKSLIEAVTDPLTHIMRNAVDHGIEAPEVRVARGKPRQGTLELRAYHEGGQVIVALRDDGAGIDPARVRRKAVEKGLLTAAQAEQLTERQAMELIFAPGFSTVEQVTSLSGRGVGMDVVKRHVERVNGHIEIESVLGSGTLFRLQIPLTLAIMPALLVEVGAGRFAIPQANLVELLSLEGEELASRVRVIKGLRVLRVRDELVPLVALGELLVLPETPVDAGAEAAPLSVVVVRAGAQHLGLLVDSIIDTEEIVVKPLFPAVKKAGCFAGSTILGDGRVALILDVPGLLRRSKVADRAASPELVSEPARETHGFLLFEAAPGVRLAVPHLLVQRIEVLPKSAVQRMGERLAVHIGERLVPVVLLDRHLPVPPVPPPEETITVLLFELTGQLVAVQVHQVIDCVDHAGDVDGSTFTADGILGSALIEGRGVLLVDLYRVFEKEDASWFRSGQAKAPEGEAGRPVRILLAEDADFFRNLVCSYLRHAGYEVTAAVDGRDALDKLATGSFDLLLTDLTMPRLDGFGLAQAVRRDARHARIPIIAITSLDSPADRERAVRVGIDDYRLKLDREELLEAVREAMAKTAARTGAPAASAQARP